MKTGLTQRGWNNVLIFASLFMIILFNSTHQKFTQGQDQSEQTPLINQDVILQSIGYSGVKLERIGASWRVVSSIELTETIDPESLVKNWQFKLFDMLSDVPELMASISRYPVVIYAHGYDQAQIFEVILEPQSDLAYVFNKTTNQWYVMNNSEASQLIPSPLL